MARLSWYLRRSPQAQYLRVVHSAQHCHGDGETGHVPSQHLAMTRREFLERGSAALLLARFERMLWAQSSKAPESLRAELVGILPFRDEAAVPMGRGFGEELDGRLYTDLSLLTPEHALTSTENFYLRTRASELLMPDDVSTIRVTGLVQHPTLLKSET